MAKRFGAMLDMSRNAVMRPEEVKKFASVIKSFGYNMIMLYTEDTYEVDGEPYFGYLRGRYSKEELKDIVAYCDSIGIEVIPCIQTLAHLNRIFQWETYKQIRDVYDILLAGDERTYALIENMFKTIRECFTSDVVHIGMDEAHMLGLGKYLDKNGFKNRFGILHAHLEKVIEIAKKYGFKPIMWSDMFFRLKNGDKYYLYDTGKDTSIINDEVVSSCPEGVDLVYWDYYSNKKSDYDIMFDAHAKFPGETWFAGGVWTWTGFAGNNRCTLENSAAALASCKEKNVENIVMTLWGDDGKETSYWSMLPSIYAVKRFYDGEQDMDKIKRDFNALTGEDFDSMMLLDIYMDFGKRRRYDNTPNKYLLYNDAFLGFLDPALKRSFRDDYLSLAEKLEAAAKTSAYSYIFESQAALCRTLATKHDLGKRTRAAYKSGERAELEKVVGDFGAAISELEKFIRAFRRLWFTDNKPHGFDVQEHRLGGVLLRLRSQKERLEAFMQNGEKIPELEEEILPYNGSGAANEVRDVPYVKTWFESVSVNVLDI